MIPLIKQLNMLLPSQKLQIILLPFDSLLTMNSLIHTFWKNQPSNKFLHIKQMPTSWSTFYRNYRREGVTLFRLRISHTRITDSYQINPKYNLHHLTCIFMKNISQLWTEQIFHPNSIPSALRRRFLPVFQHYKAPIQFLTLFLNFDSLFLSNLRYWILLSLYDLDLIVLIETKTLVK